MLGLAVATGGGAAALMAGTLAAGSKIALSACVGAAIGALATTVSMSVEDFNDGDVRSWQEAALEIGASSTSGAITGALGVKFPHMNKLLAGIIDTALSTAGRGVISWFTMDMDSNEWLAYTFDWRQIAVDFVAGVAIDCLIDGISDKISKKLFDYADGRLADIPSNVWDEGPVVRGDIIDEAEALKNNLGHNFPTIDRLSDGVAASTKSYIVKS